MEIKTTEGIVDIEGQLYSHASFTNEPSASKRKQKRKVAEAYSKKECRKGGLLKTPTKLKYLEKEKHIPRKV